MVLLFTKRSIILTFILLLGLLFRKYLVSASVQILYLVYRRIGIIIYVGICSNSGNDRSLVTICKQKKTNNQIVDGFFNPNSRLIDCKHLMIDLDHLVYRQGSDHPHNNYYSQLFLCLRGYQTC